MTTFQPELEAALAAARVAGEIQLAHLGRVATVREKSSSFDLVTEVDQRCEDAIRRALLDAFPEDAFLGEEDGASVGSSGRRWIVDPLDGTLNYAHGFPFFAVSIALEVNGAGAVGVVHEPVRGEFFSAMAGAGAERNGSAIRVSDRSPLRSALLATGFAYSAREEGANVPLFRSMLERSRGVRRAGAAALDLAYVAAGRLDGFWEAALKPWDTAAGAILVQEAGGVVTDGSGAPHVPGAHAIVCAGPSLHAELLRALQGADSAGALLREAGPR